MNFRIICVLLGLSIVLLVSCNKFTDTESTLLTIENESLTKNRNVLMKESDESELGFKPEYKIEITPETSSTEQFTVLGEQLDYLKAINKEADFKMTIDVDSKREKNFRLMIWDGEGFLKIKRNGHFSKYYNIKFTKGKNNLELNNKINLLNDSSLTELSFLLHDKDFPADIDYQYSPIRMYVTDIKDLLKVPTDKINPYKKTPSFFQSKTNSNTSGTPKITFLNKDKNVLKNKHLTDESKFVSINQTNYDIRENIVFYDIDGHVYESYFIMHPRNKEVVLPIPKEMKDNIGENDYFMLINNNYGRAGIEEIRKINKNEKKPYLNYSFSFKLGNEE